MSDYYDLGPYTRPVTTTSKEAQIWFDRGLNWCYGYNHEEAVRCFKKAAKYDPNCAMAQWGIAYAAGPNYNKQWVAFDPVDLKSSLGLACAATKQALNANTVTLISGTIGGTYVQFGADLASVLDDGNKLRVLPIVGRGSVQSVADILFLQGVDLGI